MDFIKEDLDYRKVLLRRYKSYHLNEVELCALLLIDELNRGVPHLIKPEELEPFMSISAKDIDVIMGKLVKFGYIIIDNTKHCFSLQPLKEKIFNDTIKEVSVNEAEANNFKTYEDIYNLVISALKRGITPVEYDTVNSWVIKKIDKELIETTINKLLTKRKSVTIAAIDKELNKSKKEKETLDKNSEELLKDLDVDLYHGRNKR